MTVRDKLDNLFVKVISDPAFDFDGNDLKQCTTVRGSLNAKNPKIKALALIFEELHKSIEETKQNLRLKNRPLSEFHLDNDIFKEIYRKALPILNN